MDIKPIRSNRDYSNALRRIEKLLDADEGSPEEEELEILSVLVEKWEDVHYPIGPPDPIAAIEFRMEQQGLSRKELESYLGSRQRVADILNRRRPLSVAMIRRLHEGLGIPAATLIRETPLRPYGTETGDMGSKP